MAFGSPLAAINLIPPISISKKDIPLATHSDLSLTQVAIPSGVASISPRPVVTVAAKAVFGRFEKSV